MKYAFLFNRKVTQRYILKLCALCGNFAIFAVHFYDAEIPNSEVFKDGKIMNKNKEKIDNLKKINLLIEAGKTPDSMDITSDPFRLNLFSDWDPKA